MTDEDVYLVERLRTARDSQYSDALCDRYEVFVGLDAPTGRSVGAHGWRRVMTDRLDRLDVFRILRQTIKEKYGNQRTFAEKVGCTPQYVSDVMNGRRDIPSQFLKAAGIRQITYFERVENGA